MLKPIIFWGATGHAKVLREFIADLGYELVAIFDNNEAVVPPFADVPLYYGWEGFGSWHHACTHDAVACLVAIGGARGSDRYQLQRTLTQHGCEPIVAVHPTAFVARDVVLGRGTQVLARAAVCAAAMIGEACIINTAASVDHECVLEKGVHIGPGATLTGCITVGDNAFIGAGAVVLPRVTIGRNTVIGAGAVVTKSIPDHVVAYGNPARVVREIEDTSSQRHKGYKDEGCTSN